MYVLLAEEHRHMPAEPERVFTTVFVIQRLKTNIKALVSNIKLNESL